MVIPGMADFETKYLGSNPEWMGGDHSKFEFFVKQITLKSGDIIRPQRAGVTAIVGANNAGKSTILRELNQSLIKGTQQPQQFSVQSIELSSPGNVADFFAWLGSTASFVAYPPEHHTDHFVRMGAQSGDPGLAAYRWESSAAGLHEVASFLSFFGDAQGRFRIGSSAPKREETGDAASHPVHVLEDSRDLRASISAISQRVFHRPLTLDDLAANVRLRVGALDMEVPRHDEISAEYKAAMATLPSLDDQGDGMRSFFGQILPIIAATYPLVILDEPEAFLHPPQARALGLELGKLAKDNGVQVIVATHDRNLLTGLLEAEGDVSVVRVARHDEGQTQAHQLDAKELNKIWSDPVLKYTNVLDALFHRVVVLAEAEGDCGYLAAALDSPVRPSGNIPNNEFLFLQAGGKAGLAKIATALKAVGVPVVAAPDFDVINDVTVIRRLTQSLGGQWGDEEDRLWRKATNSIRAKKPAANIGLVLESLNSAFEGRMEEPFTADARSDFNALTRSDGSPWAEVKKHGIRAFSKDELAAMNDLLTKMAECGVVPVLDGELEGLAPLVAVSKGAGWLPEALRQDSQSNAATQAHLDRIVSAANIQLKAQAPHAE